MPRTPSLAIVIEEALRQRLAHVHTNLPAKVISYDAASQTAAVKPSVKHRQPTLGGAALVEYPTIPDVPVCHPRWGSWFVHAPLAEGDFVDLIFGEASIDRWREHGGSAEDPVFDHRFDLSDAIAIPCNLYPVAQALVGLSTSSFSIGKLNGAKLHITDSREFLFGSADEEFIDQPLALAQQVQAQFSNVHAAITAINLALQALGPMIDTKVPAPSPPTPITTVATGPLAGAITAFDSAFNTTNPQISSQIVKVDS